MKTARGFARRRHRRRLRRRRRSRVHSRSVKSVRISGPLIYPAGVKTRDEAAEIFVPVSSFPPRSYDGLSLA